MRLASGLFPCEARWEETPHPARYSRHPLPKREGLDPESFQASPSGRGWPAAGAFISRSGPGEGLRPKNLNTRSVLLPIKAGNPDSTGWPGSAKVDFGIWVQGSSRIADKKLDAAARRAGGEFTLRTRTAELVRSVKKGGRWHSGSAAFFGLAVRPGRNLNEHYLTQLASVHR